MNETELESAKVKLSANGDLTITEEGTKTIVAHYDKKTGVLEFASQAFNEKFYNQVTTRIGSTGKGAEPSNFTISKITIKGVESKVDADAPEMPNPESFPEGDAAEPVVSWLLEYDLPQAIARYGIFLDAKGKPVRKKAKRLIIYRMDRRDEDVRSLQPVKVGHNSEEKAPVMNEAEEIIVDNAYIARRATALTFTPAEVIGGYKPTVKYSPVEATD